jgi:hypothetical protein
MPTNKYLLYCIFRSQEYENHGSLRGVQGQPVSLVSKNGLSAAVSGIPDSELTPDISSVLACQKIIESFHSHPAVGGVIPMRYGCLLNRLSQVLRLLKERHNQYEALLEELEGCVEMGVRILVPDTAENRNSKIPNPWPRAGMPGSDDGTTDMEQQQKQEDIQSTSHYGGRKSQITTLGRAYLAARRVHYEHQEEFNKQASELIEQSRAAFSGLFVKCKTEFRSTVNFQSTIGNLFPSIYFLVPKTSVNRFRQVFRQVEVQQSAKLLLSGPWPPYNFV